MADSHELAFQNDIIAALQAQGWLVGQSSQYDRERALYPEDLAAFVQDTQPDAWAKFCKIYGSAPEEHLLRAAERSLDRKGTLWLLRNQIEDRGVRLKVATLKPDHALDPELSLRYQANRLRVVPELVYSPNGSQGRIDLTLFVNGLPVATLELKSCFKQSLENAKKQYRYDRTPKTSGKIEPLLTFKRGAIVHFSLNQFEVAMTTKLASSTPIIIVTIQTFPHVLKAIQESTGLKDRTLRWCRHSPAPHSFSPAAYRGNHRWYWPPSCRGNRRRSAAAGPFLSLTDLLVGPHRPGAEALTHIAIESHRFSPDKMDPSPRSEDLVSNRQRKRKGSATSSYRAGS
jgi:type I site-specific restriction-modification system R (restriction) subunit